MNLRRTCDRCYKIKARCSYNGQDETCDRCARLSYVCETRRAQLKPGRPRLLSTSRKRSSSPTLHTPSTQLLAREAHLNPIWKDFDEDEISLVAFMLHPDQIGSLLYGPTFKTNLRSALAGAVIANPEQTKDGILAFAHALREKTCSPIVRQESGLHIERGSRALQRLATFHPLSIKDAQATLAVAVALLSYNDLCVGASNLPVVRSALLRAMPWRYQLVGSTTEDTDPNIICLLFAEMFESLMLAEMPIFRWDPPKDNTIIDKYYGVCHDLLPHFHDICFVFRSIRNSAMTLEESRLYSNAISTSIDQWIPETILNQRGAILDNELERDHYLLQAKAFRLVAQLLLLQVQKSPVTDMLARSKAAQLSSQIHEAILQGIGRPKYLLFPYFVACLELWDVEQGVYNRVESTMQEISNGMAPKACKSMIAYLEYVWRSRRRKTSLTWFESVADGAPTAVGP